MRAFAETVKSNETDFYRSGARQNSQPDADLWPSVSAPASNFQIQRSADCACGGDCPTCQAKHSNLPVSHPTDVSEIEADATADKIMRMQNPEASPGKSSCADCEEKLQRKENDAGNSISNVPPAIRETINSSGRPMDAGTRSFMESRFGYDFSGVKIHDNESAAKSAGSINARAYTVGKNIVFNSGQYDTNSESGKRLLAHELTHVVQQGAGATNSVQRTVGPSSTCAANVHDAPADPLTVLADADELARDKALSASVLLLLESFDFDDPVLGRTNIFDAYSHWFGTPTQTSSGQWRSRFRTATFATENEAIRHELETFSERFQRIKDWLDGNITYRCPGTSAFTIPGCANRTCGADEAAITCPTGTRRIVICPGFWAPTDQARYARYIIHEALHPLFHFSGHPTATPAGRARNPGCYQGFVREVFDGGGQVADCTALP